MAPFFAFLFFASLAVWVGSIVFFSFVAAPHVFAAWPAGQAVRAVAPMSRSFLKLGWVCGLVALGASFFLHPVAGIYQTIRVVLVAIMWLLALYLAFGPGARVRQTEEAIEAAGSADLPKDALAAFDEFHATASQLNGAILLLGFLVVFITAFYS